MQVVGFMGPPVCSGVYSAVNSRDAMRGFAGGFGGGEQAKARNGAVARGERAAHVPDRAGAGAGGGEARGRRRADAGGAVHHRPAERKEQIPFVAAYFVPGCGGRSARAGGGGGRRRGHHDPRLARWGTEGGGLDAGGYRGDGRGNGRDLGVGGGGHGDLDRGVRERTQSICVFSTSYWVRLVRSRCGSLGWVPWVPWVRWVQRWDWFWCKRRTSWVRTLNSRVAWNGVRFVPGLPIAGMRRWCGVSSRRMG